MKVLGQLIRAQVENRTSDYTGSDPKGLIWIKDSDLKFTDGSNVQVVKVVDKETAVTVADGSGPTDVTGLVFDSASVHLAKVEIGIRRRNDSSELMCLGQLTAVYKQDAAAWAIEYEFTGDDTGVTFSITGAGQVQYTSTSLAGSGYFGQVKYDIVKRFSNFTS